MPQIKSDATCGVAFFVTNDEKRKERVLKPETAPTRALSEEEEEGEHGLRRRPRVKPKKRGMGEGEGALISSAFETCDGWERMG